eukprot:GILI01019912.1.p1 GENE.GILI01019912.1~~GILI01019912.1.p1  ORF type:complete len:444 (+),score=59.18 GILI01019912.1:71-1333(+)
MLLSAAGRTLTGDIWLNVTLVGYPSSCVALDAARTTIFAETPYTCDSTISYSLSSLTSSSSTSLACSLVYDAQATCPSVPSIFPWAGGSKASTTIKLNQATVRPSCRLHWVCAGCALADVETLDFKLDALGAFALRIDWSLQSSTGIPSDYYKSRSFDADLDSPYMLNSLVGSVYPGTGKFFRGLNPTTVAMSIIPTLARIPMRNFMGTGYHAQFSSYSKGSQVEVDDFYSTDYLRVSFHLVQTSTTLEISWNEKLSTLAFLSAVGGVLSATFGLLEFTRRFVNRNLVAAWRNFQASRRNTSSVVPQSRLDDKDQVAFTPCVCTESRVQSRVSLHPPTSPSPSTTTSNSVFSVSPQSVASVRNFPIQNGFVGGGLTPPNPAPRKLLIPLDHPSHPHYHPFVPHGNEQSPRLEETVPGHQD